MNGNRMRHVLLLSAFGILLIAAGASFCEEGAKSVKVVCFGDSITYGYSASDPAVTSYPALLAKLLEAKDSAAAVKVVNAGISGEDTRQGLKRLDSLLEKEKPGIVLVLYGTNDLWTSRKISVDDTRVNLTEMITKMKSSGAVVLIGTLIPVWEDDKRVAARNDVIKEVAKAAEITVVDLNAAFEKALTDAGGREKREAWETIYAPEDGGFLHPNDKGNALLAAAWHEALMKSRCIE